jgi:nicotinate-nucleotide adenylyltransferase
MRIAIFGGSFDPPHLGHLKIAESILSVRLADQIWFVPCGTHPFNKKMSPSHNRLTMVKLMLHKNMKVTDYEVEKRGSSYSYDTLTYFSKRFPQHNFSCIIGSDQLSEFHKWKRYKDLLARFPVYVYPRTGYSFKPLYQGMIPLTSFSSVNISSTNIRKRFLQDNIFTGLVDPKVVAYIRNSCLYNTRNDNST